MIVESKDEEYYFEKKITPKEPTDAEVLATAILQKEKQKWDKECEKNEKF